MRLSGPIHSLTVLMSIAMLFTGCRLTDRQRASSHIPDLKLQDRLICDGDMVLAEIVPSNEGLSLESIRLRPGGEPLLQSWSLSWRFPEGRAGPYRLEELMPSQSGPDILRINLTGEHAENFRTEMVELSLDYNPWDDSYVYSVTTELTVDRIAETTPATGTAFIEFAALTPYQRWGDWERGTRWNYGLYTDAAGRWRSVPFNHLFTPDKQDISFPPGKAQWLYCSQFGDSPLVEIEDTSPAPPAGALGWSDFGFHCLTRQVTRTRCYRAEYKLTLARKSDIANLKRQAVSRTYEEREIKLYNLPRVSGRQQDFSVGFEPGGPDDSGFWIPVGDLPSTAWSDSGGVDGGPCLAILSNGAGEAAWQMAPESGALIRLGPKITYEISVMAGTRDLERPGARLVVLDENHRYITGSRRLTGDSNWTRLAVTILQDDKPGNYLARLEQTGQGESYFDDLRIEAKIPRP